MLFKPTRYKIISLLLILTLAISPFTGYALLQTEPAVATPGTTASPGVTLEPETGSETTPVKEDPADEPPAETASPGVTEPPRPGSPFPRAALMPLANVPVNTIVSVPINGVATDFYVVHQGSINAANYSNTNGTWLLMKDIYTVMPWGNTLMYGYSDSSIHSYLTNTFYGLIDSKISPHILQATIPTCVYPNALNPPAAFQANVFVLSKEEVSGDSASLLSGFPKYAIYDDKRYASYQGQDYYQWAHRNVEYSTTQGSTVYIECRQLSQHYISSTSAATGVRPAFILNPATLFVDASGTVISNVAPTTPTGMTNVSAVNSWSASSVNFSCNASTDVNGDTIYYEWSISVNGGAYTIVQNTTSRSFTRNISASDNYYQVRVRAYDGIDYSGYLTSSMVTVTHDTVKPTIQVVVTPNTSIWAKDKVTITVIVADSLSGLKSLSVPAGVTPTGNQALSGSSATKIFEATSNGSYTFTVIDQANNSAASTAVLTKVDNDFPTIIYTTNPPGGEYTNGDVIISLTLADALSGLYEFSSFNGTESVSGTTATKTFSASSNGTYPFSVLDAVGHNTVVNVVVNMIDRIKPSVSIVPRISQWTNAASVIMDITASDDYSGADYITLPDGATATGASAEYTIYNNGEYSATSADKAGNISDVAEVDYQWFDRTKPEIQFVKFTPVENAIKKFFSDLFGIVTNQNLKIEVTATDTPEPGEGESGVTHMFYRVLSSDGTLVQDWTSSPIGAAPVINYEIHGMVEIFVKDAAGNESDVDSYDILIDSTAPQYDISYSIEEITDQPVTVTLKAIDEPDGSGAKGWILPEGGVLVPQAEITYTFSENATKVFIACDNAGNQTEVEIRITNIESPLVPVELWENNRPVIDAVLHAVSKRYIEDVTYADLLKITYIDLSANNMNSIPDVFGEAKNIIHLDLRGNVFTEVPECVYQLTRLKYLDLSNNNLSKIGAGISSLNYLEFLDVSLNYLVDYDCPAIVATYRDTGNFTLNDRPEQYAFKIIEPDASKEYIGNTAQINVEWAYDGQAVQGSLEAHRKDLFMTMYPSYRTYRPMVYSYEVQNGSVKTATADYVQIYLPDSGIMSVALELGEER